MNKMEIYVVTHKKIDFQLPDYCKKIQVNAAKIGKWDGYLHDDDNIDNISDKNYCYCELSALYSLWKNCKSDIQGIYHYRRFFSNETKKNLFFEPNKFIDKKEIKNFIINPQEINQLLNNYEIILSLANIPFPCTAFEDLQRYVYLDDIWKMIDTVIEIFPEYKEALWEVLYSGNISYCNMFISDKTFVDKYCNWLFAILENVERKVDIKHYDIQHKRIFGYFAEILLNVYIKYNKLKSIGVYRIDLLEKRGYKYFFFQIKQVINMFLAVFNCYPLMKNRSLNKARCYNIFDNNLIPVNIFTQNAVSINNVIRNMKKYGGKFVKINYQKNFVTVSSQFGVIKISIIFITTIQNINNIINHVIHERDNSCSEITEVFRLKCEERISDEHIECLLRNGIIPIIG